VSPSLARSHIPILHQKSIPRRKSPYREWVPFFNDSYALNDDEDKFYQPNLFDLVFSMSRSDQSNIIPTHLLAAHGTFMAECWMENMAKLAKLGSIDQGEIPNEESSIKDESIEDLPIELISFNSTKSFDISTPISQLSDDLIQALVDLPVGLQHLNMFASLRHNADPEHFL